MGGHRREGPPRRLEEGVGTGLQVRSISREVSGVARAGPEPERRVWRERWGRGLGGGRPEEGAGDQEGSERGRTNGVFK